MASVRTTCRKPAASNVDVKPTNVNDVEMRAPPGSIGNASSAGASTTLATTGVLHDNVLRTLAERSAEGSRREEHETVSGSGRAPPTLSGRKDA